MIVTSISDKDTPDGNSRSNRLLHPRIRMLLICAGYVTVFVIVYKWVIVPVWGYEGFRYKTTLARAATAWVLAGLPSLWLPIKLTRPSQVVYWLLYIMVLVPACLVPVYSLDDHSHPLILGTCLVGLFALTRLMYYLPLLSLPRVYLENYEFSLILSLLSISCFSLMFASFGFHFHFVSFDDTYTVRAQFKDTLSQVSSIVAYAINWQAWVINPFVIAVGLGSRRPSWVLAGVAGQFAIYTICAFRATFFSAAFLLYIFWLTRSTKTFGIRLAASWTAISAAAGAIQFFGYGLMPELFVGLRSAAIPGLLTGYYYEFFSSHPQVHLGHSIFRSFVTYPYAVEPPYVIGYTYFPPHGMDANANIWADAYANFGYPGMVCFTILFGIVLWLYDSAAAGRDLRLAALVMGLPGVALANGGLLTSLLTDGIGLAMLLMYLTPSTNHQSSQGSVWHDSSARRRNLRWKPSMS